MIRLFIYLLLFGTVLYALSSWGKRKTEASDPSSGNNPKPSRWFRSKRDPSEIWVQVYETASLPEAKSLQARLQEEELECVVYEQGKKDIHGNPLTGIGVAVPKTSAPHAQRVISRMPT